MSDLARLETALRSAAAAGDENAARRFALEIRKLQSPQAASPAQPLMAVGQSENDIPIVVGAKPSGAPIMHDFGMPEGFVPPAEGSFEARDANLGQQVRLAAGYFLNSNPEARVDMIRNILGDEAKFEVDEKGNTIVSYGNERANLNAPGLDARDAVDFVSDIVRFAPAARFGAFVGGPAMSIFRRGTSALRGALGGGSAAMATQAASEAASGLVGSEQGLNAPSVIGAGVGGAAGELVAPLTRRFTPQAQDVLRRISDVGIDPMTSPGNQVAQVATAARGMTAPWRGSAMPDIAEAVTSRREAARRAGNEAFDVARSYRAAIPATAVTQFHRNLRRSLLDAGFDLGADGMSAMSRNMSNLAELADPKVTFPRKIQALEQWRRRVSTMSPRDGSPAEAAAIRAKNAYDDWMDGLFNNDMISGSPDAVDAWRTARSAWADYKNRFDSNRVIRDLAKRETTPEQMRHWLFNTSAVGAKKEAGLVVERLNDILGKSSPQMAALRSEVMLDIAAPLFDDIPDINGFLRNYRKWFDNNTTLRENLFSEGSLKELDDLVGLSKTIASRRGTSVADMRPVDITGRGIQLLNRILVGHGIAQGGARIQASNVVANFIRQNVSGRGARMQMLRDYMGIEPTQQLLPAPASTGASLMRLQQNYVPEAEQPQQ